MNNMIERLETIARRYEELNEILMDPSIASDIHKMTEASKEQASLETAYQLYQEYKKVLSGIEEAKELMKENDPEIKEMAELELSELEEKKPHLEEKLHLELIPKDPNDDKNIIMEIRGAAGGDEASLFAADLYNMYLHYAEKQGWKVEVVDKNETEVGGFKEIALMITGNNVYSKLKFENGAHRVQRVPVTESAGRVHTSTATVGVMPEAEDVDVDIDPKDIRVDVYRSSGAGGQHVNKTSSAVRMTHLPTGIVVAMQDERSQQQNRAKAMRILKSRVYDYYQQKEQSAYDEQRKNAIGTGDRSERIRTYNYPQNRVTDHRIGLTLNKLDKIMAGELDEIIEALIVADQAEKLEQLRNE